jgi:MFS family permease
VPLNLRSRIKFFDSFFGLTRRFKVIIFSEIFEILTYPQWFSIYLKKDLKANDMDIGLVNAVRSAVNLILQPIGGVFGQKFNKKNLYLAGLAIQASAFLVAFLAQDWTWAIFMSIIWGCKALVWPGIGALIGEITDRPTRATVFALEATTMSTVTMLSGPLQGFIAETWDLRFLYLVGIFGTMLSFFIFLKLFPDTNLEDKRIYRKSEDLSRNWREQVHEVFEKPIYRRNFIGLLQAGMIWRLFCLSL